MNLPNLQPFIFRNYDFAPEIQSHHLGSCKYRMWESIRASGAAPGYFEEYVLDDYLHQVMTLWLANFTNYLYLTTKSSYLDFKMGCFGF